MNHNPFTSQREHTAQTWTNNRKSLDRQSLIDQIALELNKRANNIRPWDEMAYQRMMAQAARLSVVSTAELQQYAIDLEISVVRL